MNQESITAEGIGADYREEMQHIGTMRRSIYRRSTNVPLSLWYRTNIMHTLESGIILTITRTRVTFTYESTVITVVTDAPQLTRRLMPLEHEKV